MTAQREIDRLRYLQAMGITPLVARRALPGARPSRHLGLKGPASTSQLDEAAPAPPAPADAVRTPPPSMARESAAALRAELGEAAPAPPSVPTRNRDPAPAAAASAERFRLAALVAGQRLWVEDLGDLALASEQVELITAIAAALLHPEVTGARPVVTQFDWPMHGNLQLDLGAEEAAASLASFLGRQIEEQHCVEVMCLGDAAAGRVAPLRLACATRKLPSTRQLLHEPLAKRELWAMLRS